MTFCVLIWAKDLTLVHISGFPFGLSSSEDTELLSTEEDASASGFQHVGNVVCFTVFLAAGICILCTSLIMSATVTLLLGIEITKDIPVSANVIPLWTDRY